MSVDMGKAKKILSDAFVKNVDELSEDELLDQVISVENTVRELNEEQKNDEQLRAAKEVVKDLNAGYTNAMKHEKAKLDYLINRINELRNTEIGENSPQV